MNNQQKIILEEAQSSPPEWPYALLRAALALFQKPPAELNAEQRQKAHRQAAQEYAIEAKILHSKEAAGVVITEQEVDRALREIRGRYPDEAAFEADLTMNALDQKNLRSALSRQCKVEAVMERIAARAPNVSEVEIGIFYHSHRERFHQPERREAFHILISLNPEFPENTREKASSRIEQLMTRLRCKPNEFQKLAQRHSECPTALEGGRLGPVRRGQLYPELDEVLFKLRPGEISSVVESPMGFHLLWCKAVQPAATISLKKAAPRIRKLLQERHRKHYQREWVASLCQTQAGPQQS